MSDTEPTRLLDYFAAQAMTGILAGRTAPHPPEDEKLAERAYNYARAMMDEHEKEMNTVSAAYMVNLKKPIKDMIHGKPRIVSANESDIMAEVAKLMEANESRDHLSQIPLRDSAGKIRHVVTTNGLARWAMTGHPDQKAADFSELANKFPEDTPLEEVVDTVANFGYVLLTNKDDEAQSDDDARVVAIMSYTDVIKGLTQ